MTYVVPAHKRSEVNTAARVLFQAPLSGGVDSGELDHALGVVNNWRAAHYYPLNTATLTLRNKARYIYRSALVSRRIKRLSSIRDKLQRFPDIKLTQMQDIGGCRAIVATVSEVQRLAIAYTEEPIWESFQRKDDYIDTPRDSGYRGIHLIYKYAASREEWRGLKIEVQLRSRRMHAWATAVEIVGTFTGQALKSSQGAEDWLRFFQLMSSAIARVERTHLTPSTPSTKKALTSELRHYADKLRVVPVLNGYRAAVNAMNVPPAEARNARWFVLVLSWDTQMLTIHPYSAPLLLQAQAQYEAIERQGNPAVDVVLASVDQARNLQRAYPNYYLDTDLFRRLLRDALA